MRKLFTILSLVSFIIIVGCTKVIPDLKGSYQGDRNEVGYVFLLTFQPHDAGFVEYIDNREVDRGTYKMTEKNRYQLISDRQNFEISLNAENSFEITNNNLNNGKPFLLRNIDDTPIYISTEFDDVENYRTILD